jgi:uncharacterized membrane protein YecN with MAPEG domain
MPVPVTALYGAMNAFLNIGLAARVSLLRMRHRVAIGHGESDPLVRGIRAHGNNAEFMPLGIAMLLVAELMGGASLWLHVLGGTLLVGRLLHAWGIHIPKAPNPPRFMGTAFTWTMIVGTGVYALMLR